MSPHRLRLFLPPHHPHRHHQRTVSHPPVPPNLTILTPVLAARGRTVTSPVGWWMLLAIPCPVCDCSATMIGIVIRSLPAKGAGSTTSLSFRLRPFGLWWLSMRMTSRRVERFQSISIRKRLAGIVSIGSGQIRGNLCCWPSLRNSLPNKMTKGTHESQYR